uniref:Uncharacterized protein n=1 Tax=Zea mays TaxID=4577 RepID=C4J891_MAIZE|nr:unknown [Zea mays]
MVAAQLVLTSLM